MHVLGYRQASPDQEPIAINQVGRFQHTYAIGSTGTGKSTFLKQSFLQDVHAGHGACYFDFHGQDAPWLLDHIPQDRLDDVFYIDPLNPSEVVGYNPLDRVRPKDFATFTDEIVASLRHIHASSWGPRMDDILPTAIRPLFALPPESQGTLLGMVRMLNDPYYRTWVVNQTTEVTVRDFWQSEFASWSKTDQAHNVNSSLNKIRRFQSAPVLRHTLGQQRSRIDFARAMERGQIIILNLDKWRMGAVNASTMAALFLSRLIYEGTHRPLPTVPGGVGEALVRPFHIYVDEFHSITTQATIEALSGNRKFSVGLTLAHQFTNQLDKPVLDAILGNVGTKVAFRVGGPDAELLAPSFELSRRTALSEQTDYSFHAHYKSGSNVSLVRGVLYPPNWQKHGYGNSITRRINANVAVPVMTIDEQYERWQNSRHYGHPGREQTVKKKKTKTAKKPVKSLDNTDGRGDHPKRHGMKSIGSIMLN